MFTIPDSTVYEYKKSKKVKIGNWAIQRGLNDLGSDLVEDGVYGRKTKKEVELFQTRYFLFVDGIFGAKSSNKLAEKLAYKANENSFLPNGLLQGIVLGESGGLIGAVNHLVSGGVDCGYCQRRVWESDYGDEEVIKEAFDGLKQMKWLATNLQSKYTAFLGKPGAKTPELAWRLATLNHNWPYGAQKIADVGISGLTAYWNTEQAWVLNINAKFPDGEPIVTPLEWAQHYSLGNPSHDEPGMMTKLVVSWN